MSAASVVLLPGMMLDARLYAHQLAHLSPAASVTVADLGRSSSVAGLAADVLRDAPPQFALVGLSMGGIVALEIWRQAHERVTHLALLDTTPYADLPERRRLRLEQMAAVQSGGLREITASLKPLYVSRRHRTNLALLQSILDMGLDLGPEVFQRQSVALRDRQDSTATLSTITCPTVVLCGREDALCPVAWHIEMARAIPDADLIVLADCGHLSSMEEPHAVTSALQRLLRRNG
jgi:pimeloyl-ACP methyl ester carboxylesterase